MHKVALLYSHPSIHFTSTSSSAIVVEVIQQEIYKQFNSELVFIDMSTEPEQAAVEEVSTEEQQVSSSTDWSCVLAC